MLLVSGADPRAGGLYAYIETLGGGGGAGPDAPGADGVQVHVTNTSNLPVESLGLEYPLAVVEYGLIAGSGDDGAQRGGRGIRRRVRILSDATVVEYSGTRLRTRPRGSAGGGPGAPGRCWVEHPAAPARTAAARSSSRSRAATSSASTRPAAGASAGPRTGPGR